MTHMTAYCIVYENIDDTKTFEEYRRQVLPTIEAFQGRFIVRGGTFTTLEGEMPYERIAVLEFPSRAAAESWYHSPDYQRMLERRGALRQAVMTAIAANQLDAILYPHQKRLVVPIGEDQAERNGVLSNSTGFPALTFPGGFSPPTTSAPIGVPIGLELLGPEWSEPVLLKLAFAYEQATRHRKPPRSTPPLK